jgi:hypothetical protein
MRWFRRRRAARKVSALARLLVALEHAKAA